MNKRAMEGTVGMIIGVIIAMIIAILLLSQTWGPIGEEILEVNATSTSAYGNLTAIYNTIPEETNSLFAFIFVAVFISVIIGVYGIWKRFSK